MTSPDAAPGGPAGKGNAGLDGGPIIAASDAGGIVPPVTLLYAHDDTTLYQIDPTDPTLTLTSLGTFDCIGQGGAPAMTNLAIDDDQRMVGLSAGAFFLDMTIVTGGVLCSRTAVDIDAGTLDGASARFYGASFAPAGTVDPLAQALVIANDQGELYEVNQVTGALTILGTFGEVPAEDGNGNAYPSDSDRYGGPAGSTFQLSGDLVFLDNGGAPLGFATVRDCASASSCSRVDTLVEIDVSRVVRGNTGSVVKAVRGQVRRAAGCTAGDGDAYGSLYGLAAYQSRIIAFSRQGLIVSIDNADGTACAIHDYGGSIAFAGAGVTTRAPVEAPAPK